MNTGRVPDEWTDQKRMKHEYPKNMNLSIGQKITNVFLQDTYIRKFISDYCLLPLYLIKDYHSVDGHIS